MAVGDTFRHVSLGSRIGPKPANGDNVQRAVCCSITASVEAMAGRLAGRSWDRAHAAKGTKAGLGLQALHVISRSEQQLSCGPVADRVPGYQTGSKLIDDGANHRVEIGDFVMPFAHACGPSSTVLSSCMRVILRNVSRSLS